MAEDRVLAAGRAHREGKPPPVASGQPSPLPSEFFEDLGQGPAMLNQSPLEMFDAAHECRHGRLPHEACDTCGRSGRSIPHPGLRQVAWAERTDRGGSGA